MSFRLRASAALIMILLLVQQAFASAIHSASKRAETGKYTIQKSPLDTEWTGKVDTSNPWPDYPRPQLERSEWKNLNGIWMWQQRTQDNPWIPGEHTFQREVLVPSCLESALSGESI